MKVKAILVFVFFSYLSFSQSPQKFTYQSIIKNSSGYLLKNQDVGLRISVLSNSSNGIEVYSEEHFPTSNSNGLVTLIIGEGLTNDNFSEIQWGDGEYFLKVEVDPEGGNSYIMNQTSQLLSVPYALYAGNSGSKLNLLGQDFITLQDQTLTINKVDLTDDVNGVLTIANGGTGSSTAPMVGVITAVDSPAARAVLGLGTAATSDSSAFATAAQGALADTALQSSNNLSDITNVVAARTALGIDVSGTDNSTNVSLAGSLDYLTLSGQEITLGQVDYDTDISNTPTLLQLGTTSSTALAGNTTTITSSQASAITANTSKVTDSGTPALTSDGSDPSLNTGITAAEVRSLIGVDASSTDNSTNVSLAGSLDYLTLSGQEITLGQVDYDTDISNTPTLLQLGTTSSTALAGNTTTITSSQASAITANTSKVTDSGTPALTSDGSDPSLNTGITAAEVRSLIGVDASSTDNSTNVSLAGSLDYLTLSGQEITLGQVDYDTDISNTPTLLQLGTTSSTALAGNTTTITSSQASAITANTSKVTDSGTPALTSDGSDPSLNTGITAAEVRSLIGVDASSTDNSTNVSLAGSLDYLTLSGQEITLGQVDYDTDISNTPTLLQLGTTSSTALAGNTTTITSSQASAITANTSKVTDSGTPALTSDGSDPSLNTGITAAEVRSLIGVDASSTDNSTNVSLAGSLDYLTLSGQEITLGQVDYDTDISNTPTLLQLGTTSSTALAGNTTTITSSQASAITANTSKVTDSGTPALTSDGSDPSLNTGITAAEVRSLIGVDASSTDNSTNVSLAGSLDYLTLSGQEITLGSITNDDLAGSIADSKLNQIITANKVAGSSVQLASGSALANSSGLNVTVDDSSIENNSGTLRVKADGISNSMIADPELKEFAAMTPASTGQYNFIAGTGDNFQALTVPETLTALGAGTMAIQNKESVNIDGGTIDGTTVATSNITVGIGKTLDVSSGTLNVADNQISGDKIEGGTIAATTVTTLTSNKILSI